MKQQLLRHWHATLLLLKLRGEGMGLYDPSWRAAQLSFLLWLVSWPCSLVSSVLMEAQYIPGSQVTLSQYLLYRSLQIWLSALLPFVPVWLMCKWEGLTPRFPLLVTSQNWLIMVWNVLAAIMNITTQNVWFSDAGITAMGTATFIIQLFYAWYFSWKALGCNPFYAAGIATMLFLIASSSGDILNVYMFGTARPFFNQ